MQFAEPELPDLGIQNGSLIPVTLKALVDVSCLTDDSNLNTSDSLNQSLERINLSDLNQHKCNLVAKPTPFVPVSKEKTKPESNTNFSLFSDEEALQLGLPPPPTPPPPPPRKGLARSRNDNSDTPIRVRKEVLEVVASTPDSASRQIESAPTPCTADTADLTATSSSEDDGDQDHSDNRPNDMVARALFGSPASAGVNDSNIVFAEQEQFVTVNVDDCDQAEFDTLVRTLSSHEQVTKLQIVRTAEPRKGCVRTLSELILFFSAVRGLPNLRDVIIWDFNPELTDVLTSFLNHHPTLESFHLHYVRGSIDRELLQALSEAPKMTNVVLEMQKDVAFSVLFASQTIRSLKIDGNFCFGKHNFVQSMRLLESNTTLRTLDLKPTIRLVGIRALSHAIGENTALQRLKVSFRPSTKAEAGEALTDLAWALSKNTTLQEVENRRYELVVVTHRERHRAEAILNANTTLQRFQFYLEDAGQEETNDYQSFDTPENDNECHTGKLWNVEGPMSWFKCGSLDACDY